MKLNPIQQKAVNYSGGPLLIVAGAGSGKTKTLTARLINFINKGVSAKSIIAITFTNKAASEMRRRVLSMANSNKVYHYEHSLFIGTFHSFGARILKTHARELNRTSGFSIFDADDSMSLMKKIAKERNINKERYKLPILSAQISKIKAMLYSPEELLDECELEFYNDYEKGLINNNAFDFDDLIEKVVVLFKNKPEILKKYQNQFRYILVDEYQDVNTAQYELIKSLAEKHKNISVVGDDAQAIYGWRYADFRNFLNFENDWEKAEIIKLEQNYRSSGNIISAASNVIKNNKLQKSKNLWTENSGGELLKIISAETSEGEANFIAETIKNFPSDFKNAGATAILYRTNAQSRALEQSLIQYQIPYKIFGGVKFYERKEIKDVIAALKIAFNPKDTISADRLKKTFLKAVREKLIHKMIESGKKMNIVELINLFINESNYFDYLRQKFTNVNERIENINEFISFASEFPNLEELLEKVSLLQSTDIPKNEMGAENNENPINLMTIHMAKGLEFDNVFLAGANEGLLPHQRSYGNLEELEEERRLMYVAMTRAKNNLRISFCHIPSRFLYEIQPELTEFINLNGEGGELPNEDEIYIR